MTKRILDYIVPALCGTFSVFLKASYWPGDNSWKAYIWPTLGAAAFYAVLTLLLNAPKRMKWIRIPFKLADEAAVEGTWIENDIIKDGVHYYSIFDIAYDGEDDKYRVSGTSHQLDGTIHAYWNSTIVKFDRSEMLLTYVYEGKLTKKGAPPIKGCAWLTFIVTRPIQAGNGHFVDSNEPPQRVDIEFERIPAGLIKQLIGRRSLRVDDRKRFVRAYHDYRAAQG